MDEQVNAGTFNAFTALESNFVVKGKLISPKVDGYQPTQAELSAIQFMINEWDYIYSGYQESVRGQKLIACVAAVVALIGAALVFVFEPDMGLQNDNVMYNSVTGNDIKIENYKNCLICDYYIDGECLLEEKFVPEEMLAKVKADPRNADAEGSYWVDAVKLAKFYGIKGSPYLVTEHKFEVWVGITKMQDAKYYIEFR